MKRILYIHHGQGIGGAPLSLLYLIKGLDKKKFHPVVLFLKDSEVIDLYQSKGIETYGPLNLEDFSHTKIWWYKWYHPHHLIRSVFHTYKTMNGIAAHWLDKIKPDIVHLNTSSLIAWGKVAKQKSIPVVWHIREPLAKGYLGIRKAVVKRFVDKYASLILPICKNDALPWKDNPKTHVVYNAVDRNMFNVDRVLPKDIKGLNSSQLKVLFLGGLSKEKGTLVIFKVFKELLKTVPGVQLIVAGYFDRTLKPDFELSYYLPTEKYKREVLEALRPIEKNAIFLGPIKTVPSTMAACDVLVFPATVGHFARPVIEAGFMKKPVVASKLSPLDELVRDGETGYLVDPNDITQWAVTLEKLLTDNILRQRMGYIAYYFSTGNFDVREQVQDIQEYYSSL